MTEVKQNTKTKSGDDKKKFFIWEIDKQMLPYKIHFFLYVGAMGALLPYHPTIGITRLGLGAANLTLVFTVQQFLFIVFKPVIGYITDYFNNMKRMIVALTIINAVLSYLLLVIPKVDDRSIPERNHEFLFAQSNICKLCPISNELQSVLQYLPREADIFRDEISCGNENLAHGIFVAYCHEGGSNGSFAFNITYEMVTCYESVNGSKRLKHDLEYNSYMNFSDIYITIYHQQNTPDLSIICPKMDNSARFPDSNFTLEYIADWCFKYFREKRPAKNTTSTRYSQHSNDIFCNSSEPSTELEDIESNSFKTYQFWLYTLLMLTSCICTSCIFTLSDTACYESAQLFGADYGNQRAWGAIGWGLFAPFSGFLNDYSDSYWPAMIIMTVLCMLQIWNLSKIDLLKPQNSENILKDIRTVLSSADFIAFDIGVLMNGMGIGTVWFFLAWFISEMGGSRFLLGLAHSVQCFLGEIPVMFLSGWLIKKIGHFNVVSMSLVATCVRFLSYSFLKDPWLILPIECLDGITFGAFYAAMTSYGKLSAKPGTEATTQSLLCSTYEGLGAGLGCVISGMCFDNYGASTTFFYAGLLFAAAAAINISSSQLLRFKKGSMQVFKETASGNVRY